MRRVLAIVLLACCTPVFAARAPLPPPDLESRVGYDQRLGAQVPRGLQFRDAGGRAVTLDGLAQGRPMLLSLGYYRCANLCGMVLHGLGDAATQLTLRPGADYEVAFVSIDPAETPADATAAMTRLAKMHPRAGVPRWHLLTGDAAAIATLANAIGFRYFFDDRLHQFAHAAGAVVLTGGDRVAQYFFGVAFAPQALRLALVDASRGRLGSAIDRLVLLCHSYDPSTGRYSLLIDRVMQVVGVGFALLVIGLLLLLRRGRPE